MCSKEKHRYQLKTIHRKYWLLYLMTLSINVLVSGQSKSGIENYNYMGNKINYTWAPVVHNLTDKGMYTEMRYNYEELKTASLYLGKSFNANGSIESSFTPAAGIVVGKYTGASMALNTELSYRNIFLIRRLNTRSVLKRPQIIFITTGQICIICRCRGYLQALLCNKPVCIIQQ